MLYIFSGPDDFTRTERLAALKEALGDPVTADMNMTTLDGRGLSLSDIRAAADTMPFLAPRRLVVISGYVSYLGDKKEELETFLAYLKNLPPSTDLVLVEGDPLEKSHPLIKAAAGLNAQVTTFGGPEKGNLIPWLVQRAKQHGAVIEPSAAELLGRLVGADLRALDNELEKLALYVNGQRPIQKADVDLLVPYTEDAERFGLANAIGQRDARRAYDQLRKELDEGQHPMAILAAIAGQMRALIEVKDMAERGLSPAEMAAAKGWRSDYAAKMRLKEAENFSLRRLEEVMELLLQIDVDIKTGRIEPGLALDTLIARLCG